MKVQTTELCCPPITEGVLGQHEADELASMFRLLADPVRLRLLSIVANAPTGEVCACDLTEPLERTQPTVSHHLSALTDAGLLERDKRGRWSWFRIVPERLAFLRDVLGSPSASTGR